MSISHKVPGASVGKVRVNLSRRFRYPFSSAIISGLWIILEALLVLGIGFATYHGMIEWKASAHEYYVSAICFITLMSFLLAHFAGLYQFSAIMRPIEYSDKVVVVFGTAFLLLLAIAFSLKVSDTFSRRWIYTFAFSACAATIVFRLVGYAAIQKLSRAGICVRNVAILGGGEQGKRLLAHIARTDPAFINVIGVFDDRMQRIGPTVEGCPVLGNMDQLIDFSRKNRIDDVVVALPWSADERLAGIVNKLRELPVNIHLGTDLAGFRFNCRSAPSHFDQVPVVEVMNTPMSGWNIVWKTLEDKILASLIALAFTPIMLLVALAIKLEDPAGPVFFRQKRFGFNNKAFYIYKFRSMYARPVEESVTVQAKRNDPRITRVGRFIRRTSLDELPQLHNVLNGTMSLVGPRPHAIDHNEEYAKKIGGYFARHRVKPGMTGWAQVNGWRGETDTLDKMEARVQHDVYYAENWSVFFDLKILFMTAYVTWFGKNAY